MSHGHCGDASFVTDLFGKGYLIARINSYFLIGRDPPARRSDIITPKLFKFASEDDRVFSIPAALHPIGSRYPHSKRLMFWPNSADRSKDL
ncbi:hypothetical protein BC443_16730 [Salinicola sp. MIT1003]|nr:hypothetical protein BC443_16730 [Salinicola sp. MIT1003]